VLSGADIMHRGKKRLLLNRAIPADVNIGPRDANCRCSVQKAGRKGAGGTKRKPGSKISCALAAPSMQQSGAFYPRGAAVGIPPQAVRSGCRGVIRATATLLNRSEQRPKDRSIGGGLHARWRRAGGEFYRRTIRGFIR